MKENRSPSQSDNALWTRLRVFTVSSPTDWRPRRAQGYHHGTVPDSDQELLVVYITAPPDQAGSLAHALVDQGLAACVNIIPAVRSIYRWKDQIEGSDESLMMIKTTSERFADLEHAVQKLHPYDVPEVLAVRSTDVSGPYQKWVQNAVARQENFK